MEPEKLFENRIKEELLVLGWFAIHLDANGCDGWPDLLALNGSEARLIEVKSGTKLRTAQKAFLERMGQEYGAHVYVIEEHKRKILLDGQPYQNHVCVLDGQPCLSLYDAVASVIR